jgi:hypothetical protein
MSGAIPSLLNTPSWRGAQLKHRDNFTFLPLPLRAASFELRTLKSITDGMIVCVKSNDSSVGIALGYGLDDRGSRFRLPAEAGNFSHDGVQNGSGAHPVSYPMDTRGSFPGGKAAGA